MEQKYNFEEERMNPFPPYSFFGFIVDLANQLDCPPPETNLDIVEFQRRMGAWETQMAILSKLRYAIKVEKERMNKE